MAHPTTVVLGLGREVGHALARRFHDAGHHVYVADSSEKKVEKARGELPEKVVLAAHDLARTEGITNSFKLAREEFGRLDNLILIPRVPAEDTLLEAGHRELGEAAAASLSTITYAIQDFAQYLNEQEDEAEARAVQSRQRGTITTVLSYMSMMSQPGWFTATTLQGAIQSLMRAAALELADVDVRVNTISALRPRIENNKTESTWITSRTPLRRVALGDEIAAAALYLASEESAIVTGETFVLDGGRKLLSGLI